MKYHFIMHLLNKTKISIEIRYKHLMMYESSVNRILFQNRLIIQKRIYQFQDPYRLYHKQKVQKNGYQQQQLSGSSSVDNIFETTNQYSSSSSAIKGCTLQTLLQVQLAQQKLNRILLQHKKQKQNPLQQILDMFQHRQQAQSNSINRVKINQMFYDLQNELDSRSKQIQQYLDELMSFNDRLVNYNPNLVNKLEVYQQAEPHIVERQLKFNLGKIIKKIYKKINEMIKRRKDQSISVETQANFLQENVIKELEKQKRKLVADLKQAHEDKVYVTNNLKEETERLKKELQRITQQRVKFELIKDEALAERNTLQKQLEKLVKVIDQMKKQTESLTYLLERQKKTTNILKKQSKKGAKPINSEFQQKENQNCVIQPQKLIYKQKQTEKQFIQELERNQLQLIKSLAKKRAKSRKKFLAPRRSKLMQTIQIEQSVLGQAMSRFSKNITQSQIQNIQKNSSTNSPSKISESQPQSDEQNNNLRQPTIQNNLQQNKNNNIDDESGINKIQKKNHKSKTFTQLNNRLNNQRQFHGQSSKSISQTQQEIQKKLEELQKMKKMKQLQNKLASMTKNNQQSVTKAHRATIGFHIQKQVSQSVSLPKNRFTSKMQSNSLHKNSLNLNNKKNLAIKFIKNPQIQNKSSFKKINQLTGPKSSASISVTSKNYLNLYEQICKQIQESKNHVGTQTLYIEDQLLKMVFDEQIKTRNLSDIILTFDAFKFGYEQFMNQLTCLIQKQSKNPIRKLNNYKGSSSVLKKSHNYRFNKQNLFNKNTWKQNNQTYDDDMSFMMNSSLRPLSKQYYVPKKGEQQLVLNNNNNKNQMNNTFGNFNSMNKSDQSVDMVNKKALNFVTISDFKSINNLFKNTSSQVTSNIHQGSVNFKKKGFYTLHHVKTDGVQLYQDQTNKSYEHSQIKISPPIIKPQLTQIRFPSFQAQDAKQLFFSIQSARAFEQKISQSSSLNSNSFLALQKRQIHYSTQILALLAHIHLVQNQIYKQIKRVLIYPTMIMNINNSRDNQKMIEYNNKEQPTQLSLKKGLCLIMQIHRKCKCDKQIKKGITQKGSKQKYSVIPIIHIKQKGICEHLINFKQKIAQVIKAHEQIKNNNNHYN